MRAGLAAAALVMAACTVTTTTGLPTPSPGVARATIPVSSAPPPSAGTGFDPVHVAQVLGPAVGTVIVNMRTGGVGEGSGFVIAADGSASYMLTNNHVIDAASKIQVLMPDGRHLTATVQGADPIQDLAVLKLPDPSLPRAVFGDSTRVQVGQPVVAIGSPHGQQGSVTVGVISALHRTIRAGTGGGNAAAETLPDVLQTDAPINPGNSGGPLADAAGQVVGVNTAASTGNSIGYAIPSLVAKRISEALIAGRKPGHPYLGVCYLTDQQALAEGLSFSGYGVLVRRVLAGTPAEQAGLKAGDVIERVDGVDLNNGQTLGGVLQLHNPGDGVRLTVLRSSSPADLQVMLADRPSSPASC